MKALLLHTLIAAFTIVAPLHADEPLDVSMIQLIATPDKFDGKLVRVVGYLHLEFEGNGLYLHREDYLADAYMNGIWFDGTPETMKKPKDFSDQYVLVVGTFDAKGHGHMGLWSGEISDVKGVWSRRRIISEPKSTK